MKCCRLGNNDDAAVAAAAAAAAATAPSLYPFIGPSHCTCLYPVPALSARTRRYNITAHLSCPMRHFVVGRSRQTERDSVVVSPAIIAAPRTAPSSISSSW